MMEGMSESERLASSPGQDDPWRAWGPYVSGRQWGTVREDYSADGDAWASFDFDQAHLRAYRWGEDGIAGLTDRFGFLNLAVALWNTHDDRLKERWFGLTGPQGNHGEDVKEYWWPVDATPTHSYAQLLYRYPQAAFPYTRLREVNAARSRTEREFELADTGVLADNRFFDVVVTHAKAGPEDVCVLVEATNHGPDPAPLHLVPQLWFRNTWAWGRDQRHPSLTLGHGCVVADHESLGLYGLAFSGNPRTLFCDNETDRFQLYGEPSVTPYPKSGVDRAVVHGDDSAVNPAETGTKVGLEYVFEAVEPGATVSVRLRLSRAGASTDLAGGFDEVMATRRAEADEFYAGVIPADAGPERSLVARRAFAGLMWGKQLYRYSVADWLDGDPAGPPPPASRRAPEPQGRNTAWRHLRLADVISMPDDWEYPWFAAWDLAFHCVALAHVDPAFAKGQLSLMCREWSQHPNGQLPAYEWSFSDVNPPVHAWAVYQVYLADGARDVDFLKEIATKLLLNYGWWVNRKDPEGSELFEGGFLGMDNISAFDRSKEVPAGWRLEQSDATSWMAAFCLSMLRICLEIARTDHAWESIATTFLERFLAIAEVVENFGSSGVSLWDDRDGFFYDVLVNDHGDSEPVRVRSMVGLIPVFAAADLPAWVDAELPGFAAHRRWLRHRRPDLLGPAGDGPDSLVLVSDARFDAVMARLADEREFLGPYGIRSLSAAYREGTEVDVLGHGVRVAYTPGESDSAMFGGNSNWRGPVWFPVNLLLVDALRVHAASRGGAGTYEFPVGSGRRLGLAEIADDLHDRLIALFEAGADGRRPGTPRDMGSGPLWDVHPVFSEYFHGDTGEGLGAGHQTGWTALVAHLICAPHGRDGAR